MSLSTLIHHDVKKKGYCGHTIPSTDLHQLCFSCRFNPKKQFPRLHVCQTIGEKSGDPSTCPFCTGVSEAVRLSWAPKRSYQGIKNFIFLWEIAV